jgi:hypothetical protein
MKSCWRGGAGEYGRTGSRPEDEDIFVLDLNLSSDQLLRYFLIELEQFPHNPWSSDGSAEAFWR